VTPTDPPRRFEELKVLGQAFDTTEVRWFAAGEPPAPSVEWFSADGNAGMLEIRRDVYRMDTDHDTGLKRRDDGPLELKRRLAVSEPQDFAGGLVGRVEEWCKTGLEEPASGAEWQWTAVDKVVLTRCFALYEGDRLREASDRELSLPACDIELATITVDGVTRWSFALEAWGPTDKRRQLLVDSLAALIAIKPTPPDFVTALGLNMGYPEWLATEVFTAR
jgi:hypothetical protein